LLADDADMANLSMQWASQHQVIGMSRINARKKPVEKSRACKKYLLQEKQEMRARRYHDKEKNQMD
jgi:hypothetical protein